MIPDGSRYADSARWTLGFKPRRNIHSIPVQISPISNGVANVDPDPKTDGSIRRLIGVVYGDLLLYVHGASHCPAAMEFISARAWSVTADRRAARNEGRRRIAHPRIQARAETAQAG